MSFEYKQNALNFWRRRYLAELQAIEDELKQQYQQIESDWEAKIKATNRPTSKKIVL